ncbi:MAG TPA: lysophospholipid acyltransferase family protein [Thermoanaerobaculia bacterium]|nr:lysophospholipid acyltransferase family protein [Thermoanaerobaculia bacterium]
MHETDPAAAQSAPAPPPRARHKWVSHGLSNRIVYGGLHYGARWLPRPVLEGINLFGNSLAVTFMRRTQEGIRENYRLAIDASRDDAASLTRRLFFEYGRAVIDTWRMRSEAFTPRITTFEEDARRLAEVRQNGRGFLLVTGHVGNWEMGAVTLKAHGLTAAVVGQPELDANVQEMRLKLRTRLGVESIDIGSSMATAFKVRAAVDGGRAVALLVDRAYPEDQVIVPYFDRPTPFLRSPALLARFCSCPILPGFFLRAPDGSYFNIWGEPICADSSLSPDQDARRIMTRVAEDLAGVIRAHPTQWFNFYRFWNGG